MIMMITRVSHACDLVNDPTNYSCGEYIRILFVMRIGDYRPADKCTIKLETVTPQTHYHLQNPTATIRSKTLNMRVYRET